MIILSIGNACNSRFYKKNFTNKKTLAEELLNVHKFDRTNEDLNLPDSSSNKSKKMPASSVGFFPRKNDFLASMIVSSASRC